MKYPYVVVGAGITGLTIAQRLAELTPARILLIEKRHHIGGNLFDRYNKHGVLVHEYGPHIFHSNNPVVWRYLSRFTDWHDLQIRVKAYIDGQYISIPINLKTLKEL